MNKLTLCAAAVLSLAALPAGIAVSQEPCTVRPFTAIDLAAGPDAINEALSCLERRMQALEERSAAGAEGQPGPLAPLAETTILGAIAVSLDHASVVEGKQLLLEYSIANKGAAPVLAIIAAFQDSSVTVRGEANPRRFRVQGFATCPTYQTRVTQNCIEQTPDAQWTLLEPGATYEFQISTDAGHGEIKNDAASARIRLIVRDGKEARFQDISFAKVPLRG